MKNNYTHDSLRRGFLKTTDQPANYHRSPTIRPPTKCNDHWLTDHRPTRNMRIRNVIANFKWISDKNIWDRVIKTIWRMWVIIFWLKPECVIEKIKSLKVKWIKYKEAYRNCIWIKRIKTGENYAETIISMSEDVSTSSTAKL